MLKQPCRLALGSILLSFLLAAEARAAYGGSSEVRTRGGLGDLIERSNQLAKRLIARSRITPPTPISVRWNPRVIWSGPLDGGLLDLGAIDLDGAGREVLVVLTEGELLVMRRTGKGMSTAQSIALPGGEPLLRPRDAIGTIAIGQELLPSLRAKSSTSAKGGSFRVANATLEPSGDIDEFPLCARGGVQGVPGRNYYLGKSVSGLPGDVTLPGDFYSASCRQEVTPTGERLTYVSYVSTDDVLQLRCTGDDEFCRAAQRSYFGVGYAHLVADVNHDGYVEVLTASSQVATGADTLQIYSQKEHKQKLLFEKTFRGAIVAMTIADLDGDGSQEVIAATRRGNRVSIWQLN